MALPKGCTPTSSSCIIWNGPRIECIDQCQNDSIEDVIYRLGQIVCSLSEIQSSDCNCDDKIDNLLYNCIVTDHQIPQWGDGLTGQEIIQRLFDEYLCVGMGEVITYQDMIDKVKLLSLPLALPECLQYVNDRQTITELTYNQYILLLAQWVCDLYDTTVLQQGDITTIQNDISIIQQWIAGYKEPDKLTITSGCASALNPGETVDIDTAFEAFEAHYCDYISILGSTAKWTTAMSAMCPNLDTEPQMQDLALDMEDLSNWIQNPITVAQNYNNLWLTVCDLRTGLQTLLESNAILPCVLAAPSSVIVDSYNAISADISWTASSLTGIEDPIGFLLEIYEWNGISQGNLIYSNSYAGNIFTANVVSGSIIAGSEYLIKLKAVYTCGESAAITTIGILKDIIILYKLNVSEVSDNSVTTDCDDGSGAVAYNYITNTATFDLVSKSTGLPVTIATNLTAVIQFTVNHPDYGTFTHNVPITIPAGNSTVNYDYVSKQTILSTGGTCELLTEGMTCGILINNTACEFGAGIVEC